MNKELIIFPIQDVAKVASAVRQASSNRRIITKLLMRIVMTDDGAVQRQIMRLHGFSLMSTVLHEFPSDTEVTVSVDRFFVFRAHFMLNLIYWFDRYLLS